VPFFRFLDFSVLEADETQILAQMPFAQRHIGNPVLDTYHGGIIASFMEAIASLCVLDDMNAPLAKPINLSVDYLRPGYAGTLNTRAFVTKKGRRMASVETLAWLDDPDKPVAKALFHFLLV
jgi:uncharacterized protein (TIGR00369 family)